MPSSIATFGRNLSNPLATRTRSSTSARNGGESQSRSEKNGEEDFFKFKESKKDKESKRDKEKDKGKDKSDGKISSKGGSSDRIPILGRVSTNNIPTSSGMGMGMGMGMTNTPTSGIPNILMPDGRIASAAASPITPGDSPSNNNNNNNLNAPGGQGGAHRKTSTDSFGSGGLGVMNIDRLTGEQKAVGALVNKLLVKVGLCAARVHDIWRSFG
jgi:hypothetical protein